MLGLFKKQEEETPEFSFRTPNQDWFEDLLDSIEYTPDMNALQQTQAQLLFVYDEMKRRHPMHKLIDGHTLNTNRPLPVGFTVNRFSLWKKPMGLNTESIALENEFIKPQIVTNGNVFRHQEATVHRTIIKGELYAVKPYRFKAIDTYKQNGVKFQRKRVRIIIPHVHSTWVKDRDTIRNIYQVLEPHKLPKYRTERAWMYVGEPDYFDPMVNENLLDLVSRYEYSGNRGFGHIDYYAVHGTDYIDHKIYQVDIKTDKQKREELERRMKRCSVPGFQLEGYKPPDKPISKPGTMSRMLRRG